jgi:hypothetical protein
MKVTITVDDGEGGSAASGMDISSATLPQTSPDVPAVSAGPAPSFPDRGTAPAPTVAEIGGAVPVSGTGESQPISAGPAPSEG